MPRAIPEQRLLPVLNFSLGAPSPDLQDEPEEELSIPVDEEFLHRH